MQVYVDKMPGAFASTGYEASCEEGAGAEAKHNSNLWYRATHAKGKREVQGCKRLGNAIIGNDGVAIHNSVPQINDDAAYRVYGRCNLKEGSALVIRFPHLAFKGVPPQVSVQSFE